MEEFHLPAVVKFFTDIAFSSEKVTICMNKDARKAISKAAISAILTARNLPSWFFISGFAVLVAHSINRPEFSGESTILIILCISSFEMNKVNLFLVPTAPLTLSVIQIYLVQMKLL